MSFDDEIDRIVEHAELKKIDYNISSSPYIHTSDAETYRPNAKIVKELDVIEVQPTQLDKDLEVAIRGLSRKEEGRMIVCSIFGKIEV